MAGKGGSPVVVFGWLSGLLPDCCTEDHRTDVRFGYSRKGDEDWILFAATVPPVPSRQAADHGPATMSQPSPEPADMTDAANPLPPESAATADGVRLAELAESLPLSRASVFEVVKALAITTSKGPGPGGRGRVAWVTATEAERITAAALAVDRGEVRIADLSRPTRQTAATLARSAVSAASAEPPDAGPFLQRLEAAERASRSGLGLTTREAAWILGVHPGGALVERGGIRATRTGYNCWRLERID
jgi:hypothetical protein